MYNPDILSENIRKYRKRSGLTQLQLAEKLFITAQTISKWELGASTPDINNLCTMADVLSVSIDTLLSDSDYTEECKTMIAIDGGGTKTEVLLFNENGDVLNRFTDGCSNPNSCGMQTTLSILKHAVDTCLTRSKNIHAIFSGMAGCGGKQNRNEITRFMKKAYPNIRFKTDSDIYNVIHAAGSPEKCLAVISGTGCIAYAKTGDKLNRMGGWGYLFDRGGSGYDFGRDAICAALADNDGSGRKTLITELVREKLGANALEKLEVIYAKGKDYVASFSPVVFEAFEQGDSVAAEIIENNAKALAELIYKASLKYDCGKKIIMSGGLILKQQAYRNAVLKLTDSKAEVIFSYTPQVIGAAVNCCNTFASPCESFKEILEDNYRKFLNEND